MDTVTLALNGSLPFIGIHTDDTVNYKAILAHMAKRKVLLLPNTLQYPVGATNVYLADYDKVSPDWYKKLSDNGASAIVLNPEKPHNLIFDAGELVVPETFYAEYLAEFVEQDKIPALVNALKGLSLKTAQEIVQLTMARTGEITPKAVRNTRLMMVSTPGLQALDTDYPFYLMTPVLKAWVDLNKDYFLSKDIPEVLVPRGLMLAGPPGVGKSLAASVIARHWGLPLFRLDIGAALSRWLGESEGRINRNLSLIEANAPVVLLLDEVEKLFADKGDETTQRILSQLLWWLQCRRGRVLTLMTTNDITKIPKELYRPGRIDRVIHLEKLSQENACIFAEDVYRSVLGSLPGAGRRIVINNRVQNSVEGEIEHPKTYSHAFVTELVYDTIRENGWVLPSKN
jgi:hypothetical protein